MDLVMFNQIAEPIKAWLMPLFTALMSLVYISLVAVGIWKGVIIGIKMAAAADNPEERKKQANALKWLIAAIIIALVASSMVHTIVAIFTGIYKPNLEIDIPVK